MDLEVRLFYKQNNNLVFLKKDIYIKLEKIDISNIVVCDAYLGSMRINVLLIKDGVEAIINSTYFASHDSKLVEFMCSASKNDGKIYAIINKVVRV